MSAFVERLYADADAHRIDCMGHLHATDYDFQLKDKFLCQMTSVQATDRVLPLRAQSFSTSFSNFKVLSPIPTMNVVYSVY